MATEGELRERIVTAAREVYVAHGYAGSTEAIIARQAGVTTRTLRRLFGGRREILVAVLGQSPESQVGLLLEQAAGAPSRTPPLSALIEAAHRLFTAPELSWDPLELEALARARLDPDLHEVATQRVAERSDSAAVLAAYSRQAGGIDPDLSDNAIVHLSMALSVGLAMLDPVSTRRPTALEWDAMIARIGAAVAPEQMLLQPDYEVGTRWRVRVDIPDQPGGLARAVRAFATLHVYTVELVVVGAQAPIRTIDMALIAPPHVSGDVILAAARSAGANAHVTSGSINSGRDLPTRMLDAATYLIKNPGSAPMVAAGIVEADQVEIIDATEGVDDRADVLRLQWTTDQHVVLKRDWAPFAGAEQSRASALLRLAAAIATRTGDDEAAGWVVAVKDSTVWIRLARPEDASEVAAMHDRCSERSRFQRYFSLTDWRDIRLRRLAGGHRGASLVAMSRDGDIIALGNVFPESGSGGRTGEIALIVQDAAQGTGVGTALLDRLVHTATRIGFEKVVAHVLAENAGMKRLLDATGLTWTTSVEEGVLSMTAELALAPPAVGQLPADGAP
jgi:AcrR family transcriptional regulator/RimJ/RimL family protein N-acetyltransferase